MDVFICGVCKEQFFDIAKFMDHKKDLEAILCTRCQRQFHYQTELIAHIEECSKNKDIDSLNVNKLTEITEAAAVAEEEQQESYEVADCVKTANTEGGVVLVIESSLTAAAEGLESQTSNEIFVCKICNNFSFNKEVLFKHFSSAHDRILTDEDAELEEVMSCLSPLNSKEVNTVSVKLITNDSNAEKSQDSVNIEKNFSLEASGDVIHLYVNNSSEDAPKKRRGRPRKVVPAVNNEIPEGENQDSATKDIEKEEPPKLGKDGKYHCNLCKRVFNRERQIIGHKCIDRGDYIDISRKDVRSDVSSDEFESDLDIDNDTTDDFKAHIPGNQGKRRSRINKPIQVVRDLPSAETSQDLDKDSNENKKCQKNNDENRLITRSNVEVPVFNSEEERLEFEAKMDVDLSFVDNMFVEHIVEQDMNENAPKLHRREKNELNVYSCNTCKKVFKTLSHIRLHCLTHTDMKPFKCPKCDYSSNAKGNVYTHMRKHTGNYFVCRFCGFQSINRTHLLEHEATHTGERQICKICKRDYNTVKSLCNHVRKYHRHSVDGKQYLSTFIMKKNKGAAILHQCHVCNRKFKKKIDRDRHLYVHNIKDNPNIFCCDMCSYTSSRRTYLEKHYRKHRVIYVCSECKCKFQSSIKLKSHVEEHLNLSENENKDEKLEQLFINSVNYSWYLPEPDGTNVEIDQQFINMPYELFGVKKVEDETNENIKMEEISQDQGESVDSYDERSDINPENAIQNIVKVLKYRPLSMDIFSKMRSTFGYEECDFCGRLFYCKTDFEPHYRTHIEDKPFKCEKCDYSSATKDNLKRHIETVHEKKQFPCEECNFIAISRTSLWNHLQKHKMSQQMECPACKILFTSKKKLRLHILTQHRNINREEVRKITSMNHRMQGRIGRRSFKCPYCFRIFHRSNTDLQKHIWIHEGIKPYKCPLCTHTCRSRNNLSVHMLRHSQDKPHLCEECGKSYKSKTALRWHVRMHTQGKIYSCSRCSYTASQKSHLKRHMETHEIIKRYVCQLCEYSANTPGYMKIHYSRKHKGNIFDNTAANPQIVNDTKVYKCLSCEYLFGNLSDMKRHLRVRHHIHIENISALQSTEVAFAQTEDVLQQSLGEDTIQLVQFETPEDNETSQVALTNGSELHAALQYESLRAGEIDEKTVSAVNILQQIIEQGAFNQQQMTINSEDGQSLVAVNPDTIIVQQGEELVVSNGGMDEGSYVIHYVTEEDHTLETQTIETA